MNHEIISNTMAVDRSGRKSDNLDMNKRMTTKTTAPDAWYVLVMRYMSNDEIRQVLTSGEETDVQKLTWLRDELLKRSRGAR